MTSEFNKDNSKNQREYPNSNLQLQTSITDSNAVCSVCKSNQIITDIESGEIICSKCGQVISEKVQEIRPEWRNFASQFIIIRWILK